MLVPRSRLLVWVAVIVLPFALLAAIEPATTVLSLLIIGALVAVALADAVSARASLAGLSLELPAVTRMSKEREGKLEVRIRNPRQKPRILRLALAWPPAIQSPQEEVVVTLSAESEWSRFDWAGRPCKRGNYQVKAACLETSSPLGFWGARKTVATQSEIRVYPNLAGERKQLAALFLHRGAFGVHAQRQIGQGRDFEKLREYIPGDSYDEIHWKATAKRGRPVTKVFQIERTQEVY
ncbi:MAG TPA: DUF58 domain-containing protein, partial [Candidatus Sulfotelmatobacter sp.]|nr:DUF58 domain-containing protein [Candidatus Sulfotelmatobacter sp.]